jgi:amidase
MMSSIGPTARTVEDLALLDKIISGPDGRDTEVRPLPAGDAPDLGWQTMG